MWQPLISGESRCECLGVITVIFQLFCIIFFLKVGRENERIWDPKILYKMMQEKNEKKKKKKKHAARLLLVFSLLLPWWY